MLMLTGIVGNVADPALAGRLDELARARDAAVEHITLSPEDVARRRLRVRTDRGTEAAIVLGRSERLDDGAVLLLEADRAVVVRLKAPRWLGLRARDAAAALEVGYTAGNMHWKIRFDAVTLWVRVEGDLAAYHARVAHLLASGRATLVVGAPDAGNPPSHGHGHEHEHEHEHAHAHLPTPT